MKPLNVNQILVFLLKMVASNLPPKMAKNNSSKTCSYLVINPECTRSVEVRIERI